MIRWVPSVGPTGSVNGVRVGGTVPVVGGGFEEKATWIGASSEVVDGVFFINIPSLASCTMNYWFISLARRLSSIYS
jgi:hypothetical protein